MARKRPGRGRGGGGDPGGGNQSGSDNSAGTNPSSSVPVAAQRATTTTTLSTSSSSAAAPPPLVQPKPAIPSSFDAARSSATSVPGVSPRAAAPTASSPRPSSSVRPTSSGFEGTLSAGPKELAGYTSAGTPGDSRLSAAARDPERAIGGAASPLQLRPPAATSATTAATTNGNNNDAAAAASASATPPPSSHHHGAAASVATTIVTLLSLQLGWGLWLLPADFARLGWLGAGTTVAAVAALTAYSASLFPRLVLAVEGAVLFGDVGEAAAGRKGRAIVYAIIYTLDASRCVVLHLAATQALQHAAGNPPSIAQWHFGAIVAILSFSLAQARNLAHMSKLLAAGTAAQLFAVCVVMATLISKPDRSAPPTKLIEYHGFVKTAVAILNVFFAYGGQFAFTEIIVSMKKPMAFARAAGVATAVMTLAYSTLGAVGYASRGSKVHEIVIFALGEGPWERAAAGAVLLQALAQYLVNLNLWSHNLLVLLSRARAEQKRRRNEREGGLCEEVEQSLLGGEGEQQQQDDDDRSNPRVASDHPRRPWVLATLGVVSYSFAISMSLPFFSSLVGLLVAGTYLAAAYVLPCWFALRLDLVHGFEAAWCKALIVGSCIVSAVGLAASVLALVNNIGGGPAR